MPREDLRGFFYAVAWACGYTWGSLLVVLVIALTVAGLASTWYETLLSFDSLEAVLKLGAATAGVVLLIAVALYAACVGYCRLLLLSTVLQGVVDSENMVHTPQ